MMTIHKWLLVSLIISVAVVIFIDTFVSIRNDVAYRNRCKIIDAIYDKMESHNKTIMRFWDFGCKRILPKQEFDKIKDFIK